eukprot:2332691-Alexandrium_andersonii.AAC.1
MLLCHPGRDVRSVVHGDDFAFTGHDGDFDWAQNRRGQRLMCKVEGRLGGGAGDLREARLLNRVIRWAPGGL